MRKFVRSYCKSLRGDPFIKIAWLISIALLIFIISKKIHHVYLVDYSIIISNIILAITALVIFWYTCETYKLRKLSERQLAYSVRPFLICELAPLKKDEYKFSLTNIGNGAAFHIKIIDLKVTKSNGDFELINADNFENEIDYIYKKQSRDINFTLEIFQKIFGTPFKLLNATSDELTVMKEKLEKIYSNIVHITIQFDDILMNKFITILQVGKGKAKVLSYNPIDLE